MSRIWQLRDKIFSSRLWAVFLILILALILRLVYLEQVPPGIANDEINIIINAQSILKTGSNIPGVVTGILGNPRGDLNGGIHSEFSSYLLIPFLLITGFVWPWIKLPFVFAALGIIVMSYLLVRHLISEKAALTTALVAAFSPWTIFFGRSGYESILSSFFYLLAVFLVLTLKKWKILWSIPFFVLGLGCYFSAKTLMLPIVMVAVVGAILLKPKESKIPGVVLIIVMLLFMMVYLPILKSTPAGERFDELTNTKIADLVNIKRTASVDVPLMNVYENKVVEDLKYRLKASLGGFSLSYLFLDGQPENIPSLAIPDHSFLYLIDLPFILLGIFYQIRSYPKAAFLIGGLLATTLIPNSLNLQGTTYSIRTVILFPILTIVSALGISFLIDLFKKKFLKYGIITLVVIVYGVFIGNFIFQYFGRLPIDRNEGWFLPQRTAIRYTTLVQSKMPEQKVIIISQEAKTDFYRYLLFSDSYTVSAQIKNINQLIGQKNYSLNNLTIIGKCPEVFDLNQIYLLDHRIECNQKGSSEIASIKDAGTRFRIINDALCSSYRLSRYPIIKSFSDLDMETLSEKNFCTKFVTQNI